VAEEKTNWISWILQGLIGLICGLYGGFALSHTRDGPWMQPGCTALFVWGATLLGAGIATIYGDQLWLQFPNQTYPPEKVPSGRVGKFLSQALCVAGTALIVAALIRNWTS
jgi:hypothetical protein